MARNLTTKLTIENLTSELKKKFDQQNLALQTAQQTADAAFKSGQVTGNTVSLYTSADKSGEAAFTFDFPTEYFLDQAKSQFVQEFAWSEETYPGSANPNLDGKPVMVLAVKTEDGTGVTYSFVDLTYLLNTYTAKATGKDASTTITIDGYEIEVKVNISAEAGNILQLKEDGLYVPETPVKVDSATEGNLVGMDANGALTDSGVAAATVLTEADISDYTAEEIAAMLSGEAAE